MLIHQLTQEGYPLDPAVSCRPGGTHCSCQVAAYPAVGQELQFDVRVPLPAVLDVLVTSYAVLAVKQKQATVTTKICSACPKTHTEYARQPVASK